MPSKKCPPATAEQKTALRELFHSYTTPPSPLHEALQEAALQAGWVPPWERKVQTAKKRAAGERSGLSRGALAQMRQSLVHVARASLIPEHRRALYSSDAFSAL